MLRHFKRILIVCPHTDDELFCTATISSILRKAGNTLQVKYVAFSACEESVPSGYPADITRKEAKEAMLVIGVTDVLVGDFSVRTFPAHRQEILELLIELQNNYCPDLVFCPCSKDIHQDHEVIHKECFRAFKHSTILGYEAFQNAAVFDSSLFVEVGEEDIVKKLLGLSKYESQRAKQQPYTNFNVMRSLALLRGAMCGVKFAEAFEVIRMVLR